MAKKMDLDVLDMDADEQQDMRRRLESAAEPIRLRLPQLRSWIRDGSNEAVNAAKLNAATGRGKESVDILLQRFRRESESMQMIGNGGRAGGGQRAAAQHGEGAGPLTPGTGKRKSKTGMLTSAILASELPIAIDKATPGGRVPEGIFTVELVSTGPVRVRIPDGDQDTLEIILG
jgi:hypothetical protein